MKQEYTIPENFLEITKNYHSDFVDSVAYMHASLIFKYREEYCLLYIKRKPKYLPELIYKWLVSKIVCLAKFNKYDNTNR